MKFEKLFEPVSIGEVPIKNRIVMSPVGLSGLGDHDFGVTQRAIDLYTERAAGGVGLIIFGPARPNDMEAGSRLIINRETMPTFSELAKAVHRYGTKIFIQLTAGLGRMLSGPLIDGGFQPISASAVTAYWRPNVITRALTTEEVEEIVIALGNAAVLLKAAGVDGIELHGHNGYLFDQFATAIWNKRNDKYSGGLKDRLRFPVEVLNAIKSQVGREFPVTYRYGPKHYMKGPNQGALRHENYVEVGRDIDEGVEMARLLEEAGVDALHLDAGCYESMYWSHPPTYQPHGCLVGLAEAVKKVVTVPVIIVGKLDIPELAEKVLKEGKADMIALARGLLTDPQWPTKVREGNTEDIRPCTGCHDGCMFRPPIEQRGLSCAVNPATGRERVSAITKEEKPKKVLIAGGGIAGMEAARIAAIRGSKVTLYEKSDKLGGHVIAGSVPDFKLDDRRLLDWYKFQLKKLGVEIKLQVEVTPELTKEEQPDKVIIATGSAPIIPGIPGIDKPKVATCIDLLLGTKEAGERVVVIGGGLVGSETALWLAQQGRKVVVVETLPNMATGLHHANRLMLLDMLKDRKVECLTNTSLAEVVDDGVIVIDNNDKRKTIPCDTVALAVGLTPRRELYQAVKNEIAELYLVGDCKEPRKIMDAIWDGFDAARC